MEVCSFNIVKATKMEHLSTCLKSNFVIWTYYHDSGSVNTPDVVQTTDCQKVNATLVYFYLTGQNVRNQGLQCRSDPLAKIETISPVAAQSHSCVVLQNVFVDESSCSCESLGCNQHSHCAHLCVYLC